jgi:hypothetical protein
LKGFTMVLLAANEPGGTEGFSWEKAGDAGAIEVPPRVAHALLSIPGELFYIVQKEVKKAEEEIKKVEAEVEKVVPKKAATKAAKEETTATDVSEALDAASPTKRRTKE